MGKGVGDRIKEEELKKKNQEIAELSASLSEGEPEGAKMPFFLPRKHSVKNYYEDSDLCVWFKQFRGGCAWAKEEWTKRRASKTGNEISGPGCFDGFCRESAIDRGVEWTHETHRASLECRDLRVRSESKLRVEKTWRNLLHTRESAGSTDPPRWQAEDDFAASRAPSRTQLPALKTLRWAKKPSQDCWMFRKTTTKAKCGEYRRSIMLLFFQRKPLQEERNWGDVGQHQLA